MVSKRRIFLLPEQQRTARPLLDVLHEHGEPIPALGLLAAVAARYSHAAPPTTPKWQRDTRITAYRWEGSRLRRPLGSYTRDLGSLQVIRVCTRPLQDDETQVSVTRTHYDYRAGRPVGTVAVAHDELPRSVAPAPNPLHDGDPFSFIEGREDWQELRTSPPFYYDSDAFVWNLRAIALAAGSNRE